MIWNELGVSGGTALIVLCALYFVVKWAVRNGIQEAYAQMNGGKGWFRGTCEKVFSEGAPSEPGKAPN